MAPGLKIGFLLAILLGGLVSATAAPSTESAAPTRERRLFTANWLFKKGDPAGSEGKLDYKALQPWLLAGGAELCVDQKAPARPDGNPGGDVLYTQPGCPDSDWRQLDLPHDWGIEGPFKQEYPGDTGKRAWWGIGWYRKHFTVPAGEAGKHFALEFDGAMSYASVWVNGQFAGGWPYGYASWQVDVTPYLKPGEENVLAVRLENLPNSSRWYPGGGIYRNVWLVKTAPVHVAHWGSYVTTPEVSSSETTVETKLQVANDSPAPTKVRVRIHIYELGAGGGRGLRPVVSSAPMEVAIEPNKTESVTITQKVLRPRLWRLESPARYLAVSAIEEQGRVVDEYETPFGIRTVAFSPEHGFVLNGDRIALNGVCNHHDLGALGSAINTRALERQIQLLQEMGCTAIRTSHNPPAPELLDLCDQMGMVVMDEAFDCWEKGKTKNDYHLLFPDWHERDLRALVRRDRNHPCVVLWSIGNEVLEQWSPEGQKVAKSLTAIARSEDSTRPVTAGCNDLKAGYNGFQKQVDVFGYNYKPFEYGKFREANPEEPLYGSETASCVSSRGEYFFPVSNDKSQGRADFQVSSYDLYAPPWATTPDAEFKGQDEFPFVAGEFVWTGFDYLGEPTPYNSDASNLLNFTDPGERARLEQQLKELGKIKVPSRSSYFGILDLAGFKKDRFYIYQARWRPDLRMAHILPHWNWPERVGQVTPVHVYTSGDEAELFLNRKSLGRKKRGPNDYRLRWDDVVYQPGELRVVAYKKRNPWAEDVVRTTGHAAKVVLEPDRNILRADKQDLCFVSVTIADSAGQPVPRSHNRVVFEVEGAGEIIAVDNGDATSLEPFIARECNAYNGRCLVIIRSNGKSGQIALNASSGDLAAARMRIVAR
jgi:beta-galactosidase